MSANEKKSAGWGDPKTAREAQQRKAEKRSNLLYATIAVVFVLVAVVSLVWRSNVLSRVLPAVTINGENYTAAEVTFYYQNVYQSFLSQNSYYASYLGLNTNESLRGQTIDEVAAETMGVEAGTTWHEYFLDQALKQMATVQAGLDAAEAEGFVYPDSVQQQYEESVEALESSAAESNLSADDYLQSALGTAMTEEVYNAQVLRMLQFTAYSDAYTDGLTYTEDELEAAYEEDPNSYDLVSYETVSISGVADSTTDEDGNTVSPTQEESDAAKAAAEEAANEMLAAYEAGGDLETLADANEKASYTSGDDGTYLGDTVTEWLFDAARQDGDAAVLNNGGSTYYVVVFHDRYRETYDTVDIRHILIPLGTATLSSGDEGYEEEQAQLQADARAQAEELLAQWESGEATEESFATLAMEHSADGSRYEGGLYTQVYHNEMVETFNDWCFDPARQSGDTGIVETQYGAHVMYFVGTDIPRWESQVTTALQTNAYTAWIADLGGKYVPQQHGFALKMVG